MSVKLIITNLLATCLTTRSLERVVASVLLNESSLALMYMHHHACISMDTVFAGTRAYYEEYTTIYWNKNWNTI
jgi:hypothetical protein